MGFYYPRHLGARRRASAKAGPEVNRRRTKDYEVWREGVEVASVDYEEFSEEQVLHQVGGSPLGRFTLILGEPGAGKTTLLSHWFGKMARNALYERHLGMVVPVRVLLREQRAVFSACDGDKLADALWSACASEWVDIECDSDEERHALEEILKHTSGRLFEPLWFFDGLDELSPEISYSEKFYKQIVNLPGRKVITARSAVFPSLREVAGKYQHREYEIIGLKPIEQREFLREVMEGLVDKESASDRAGRLFEHIQGNIAVRLLAGNPLMLTLIAEATSGSEEMRLPQSRSQFYQEAIEKLWNRKLRADPEAQRLRKEREEFLVQKAQTIGLTTLRAAFDADGPLARGLRKSGLVLVNDEDGTFEFLHLTFQEYYLAKALSKRSLQAALQKHWSEPRYEETLGLLISILFRGERFGEIEAGLRWLIDWGKAEHQRDPKALWDIGRSPLRTVIAVLGRSAVPLNAEQLCSLETVIVAEVGSSKGKRLAVAAGRQVPVAILWWLAADGDSAVRERVGRNAQTPLELLARLATDGSSGVRSGVADNRNTPPELLARLADDNDYDVRSGVADNANTAPEVLAWIADNEDSYSSVRVRVAENANTPPEVLTRLATDEDKYVRWAVAGHTTKPAELMARLDKNRLMDLIFWEGADKLLAGEWAAEDSYVHGAVAENANTPPEILTRLAADENRNVRWRIAVNTNTPPELLTQLAADQDSYVRSAVAGNGNTPVELLARLAADEDKTVRSATAWNANTPAEILARLADDEYSYVSGAAAWNANAILEDLGILRVHPRPPWIS
jgi:RecA/RadA recombinase